MNRAFQPKTERVQWSDNEELFQKWCEGKTGFPIVDAGKTENGLPIHQVALFLSHMADRRLTSVLHRLCLNHRNATAQSNWIYAQPLADDCCMLSGERPAHQLAMGREVLHEQPD